MNRARGVTLLELLAAITLLGLISLGLLTSLRIGSSAWRRGNQRMAADRRVLAAADLLSAQLANAQARVIRWGPAERGVRFAYFDGASDRLRFLTTYSLEARSRGGLWLAEYFFARREDGACDLLYNEWPLRQEGDAGSTVRAAGYDITLGRQRVDFAPAVRTESTREIYRGLRQCRFEYLIQPLQAEAYWGTRWETDQKLIPRAVAARFEGVPAGGIEPVGTVATLPVREVVP